MNVAISMNVLTVCIMVLFDKLNASLWSPVNNEIFHLVFGFYSTAFIGSIIACYIAQKVDVLIYLGIRRFTGPKWLWLRNNVSTAIALLIDTMIVISFMSFFGALPKIQMWLLIWNSYVYKLFFSVLSTPVFYMIACRLQKIKGFR